MSIGTVTVTVNSYKRDMAESLAALRKELIFDIQASSLDDETIDAFNNLACSINSFVCVSMEGAEEFTDLSGEIKDVEMIEGEG